MLWKNDYLIKDIIIAKSLKFSKVLETLRLNRINKIKNLTEFYGPNGWQESTTEITNT